MVLSDAELKILTDGINSAHNVSSYGYEVAVKGTMIDGISIVIVAMLSLLVTIYTIKKINQWIKVQHEFSKEGAICWGILFSLVVYLLCNGIFYLILHDAFMYIFAPEYVVLTKIMAGATAAIT